MQLAVNDFAGLPGYDCSVKLNPKLLAKLLQTQPYGQVGQIQPPSYIIRYVFFGPAIAGDIDQQELELILSSGCGLGLVQHPRLPKYNVLSESTGASDASWAIKNALGAGYDPSKVRAGDPAPTLFLDMEGVANPGPSSQAHAVRWVNDVRAAGFRPGVYFGFDWGVSDTGALGDFCAWCDFANLLARPKIPYDLKQGVQMNLGPFAADPDIAYPAPRSLTLMVNSDPVITTGSDEQRVAA